MNIGKSLKKLRQDRNLTLSVVAKATGFSISVISEYENNITEPSVKRLITLFDFYGVNSIAMLLQNREIIDITDYSPIGKQKAFELEASEKKKKLKENI